MRESFTFYRSIYEAIRDLPREVQGEIYTAIMEYGLYGKETASLKPIARSIFTLAKPLLRYDLARFENGNKGGRPKKSVKTEQEPRDNLKKTSKNTENEGLFDNLDNNLNLDNILENNINLDNNNNNSLSPLPPSSQSDETEAEFERFWDLYDKKHDKEKTRAKFKKLTKTEKAKIFETLPAYIESTPDKQYRKNPLTYLNNQAWNNEIINDNGPRQPQYQQTRQPADFSKFRDSSRTYSSESDF